MSCGFIDPFRHGGVSRSSCSFNGIDQLLFRAQVNSPSESAAWTWSGWIKPALGTGNKIITAAGSDSNDYGTIFHTGSGDPRWLETISGSVQIQMGTDTFLANGEWTHLVVAVATTQAAAGGRLNIWFNGSAVGEVAHNPIEQDYEPWMTSAKKSGWAQGVGARTNSSTSGWPGPYSGFFDGLMTEVAFVDGKALAPASFAESNKPLDLSSLDFGTNGYWLRFKTQNDLGHDSAGIGDFTLVNLSSADYSSEHP